MRTAASPASATCCPGTRPPTGSALVARERPRGQGPTALSSSRRLSISTGSPISCRRRENTGIAITGMFVWNHKLRPAVTTLAIGNVGTRGDAATGGHKRADHATGGCYNVNQKPRSHDTLRIAWAKLMARVGEELPLECPGCGGDIRLIEFITDPGPIRKIQTHLGEPLEPPPLSPARGPPAAWGELVQVHDDRAIFQESPDELPVIDIHSLWPASAARRRRRGNG